MAHNNGKDNNPIKDVHDFPQIDVGSNSSSDGKSLGLRRAFLDSSDDDEDSSSVGGHSQSSAGACNAAFASNRQEHPIV